MAGTKLIPEKITSPMQLMAAWFSMLMLLEGVLLTAAANIGEPSWAAGYLVVFASLVVLLVLGCVTLMLTKFRPHLQDGREYAQWLKDRNVYTQATVKISKRTTSVPAATGRKKPPALPTPAVVPGSKSAGNKAFLISISNCPGGQDIADDLRRQGFVPEIYYGFGASEDEGDNLQDHEAIWVGTEVPAGEAVQAIKIALARWPHLKYMHMSNDGTPPPDEVHHQLYIGGATSTARQYGLRAWRSEELQALREDMDQNEFHNAIRAKY